jgi:hypothetical protein
VDQELAETADQAVAPEKLQLPVLALALLGKATMAAKAKLT